MAERPSHRVDPSDEGRHPPAGAPLWNESVYLDVVADDGGLACYARIGVYPNLGATWWTAMIVGPGRPVIASVAYDLARPPGASLMLESDGYALAYEVGDPLATARLVCQAPATSHDDPAAVYRGDPGAPVALRFDLVHRTDGSPYAYDGTTRYEVPCLISGEVAIDRERIHIEGTGQRDHSWGVRDWWAFGWCWAAARLDDGTRIHWAHIRIPGHPMAFGYVQRQGEVVPVASLDVTEVLDDDGMPRTATAPLTDPDLRVHIDPIAFGPVILRSPDGRLSRFPRAMARFTTGDGRSGLGWIEWNQPETPSATR